MSNIAVLQEANTENNGAFNVNQSVTITVSAGSALVVFCNMGIAVGVSDTLNGSYGTAKAITGVISGRALTAFVMLNAAPGVTVISGTTATAGTGQIWVVEVSPCAAYLVAVANVQTNPGAGADAITSGLIGTLSNVPALIVGITKQFAGATTPPSAGTGFTAGTTGWGSAGTARARSENLRVTASTSIAATFTSPDGAAAQYQTIAVALAESPIPAPIAWTTA